MSLAFPLARRLTRPPSTHISLPESGFSLSTYLSSLSEGAYYDFTIVASTWQDTAATTPADEVGEAIARVDDLRVGTGGPHNGTQATGANQPIRQTTGAKFDGTDDVLVTALAPASGANFIMGLVTVPATLAAAQMFCGSFDATNRFFVGFNTAGRLCGGMGTNGSATVLGSAADYRSQEVVVAVSTDGATVKLFGETTEQYSAAQAGSMPTTRSVNIGAYNNNSGVAGFFAGSVKKLIVGRDSLTLAKFLQLRTALLSSFF